MGRDFSRYGLERLTRQILVLTYQPKGYWAASFSAPVLETGAASSCFGISVSLTVNEGDVYVWDHAIWQGNTVFSATVLDRAVGMSAGDLADRAKLEDRLHGIGGAYREHGYLAETHTATANLDTKTHRAMVTITIDEGAPYTMGTLEVVGTTSRECQCCRALGHLLRSPGFELPALSVMVGASLEPMLLNK